VGGGKALGGKKNVPLRKKGQKNRGKGACGVRIRTLVEDRVVAVLLPEKKIEEKGLKRKGGGGEVRWEEFERIIPWND